MPSPNPAFFGRPASTTLPHPAAPARRRPRPEDRVLPDACAKRARRRSAAQSSREGLRVESAIYDLGMVTMAVNATRGYKGNIRLTNHVLILGLSESVGEKTKSTLVNDNLSLLNGYNLGYAPFSDTPISKHTSYFTCKNWRTCFKEQIRILCLTT